MADKIPKPSDVDAANIKRPTVQQLSVEHQKALDDCGRTAQINPAQVR